MPGVYKVGPRGLDYYVGATVSRPDALVEPVGRWLGTVANELGVRDQPIDGETLAQVLRGRDPSSGLPLGRTDHIRTLAYDIVLTSPKAVSILHALGEPATAETIARAHAASVEEIVSYFERTVAFVRRGSGEGRVAVPTGGLLAAAFEHRTSRAPDPHLHTHLLIANLGRDDDGKWSALDARELFAHLRVTHALYGAHLRQELTQRDAFVFARRRSGVVDLLGASDTTIALFSRRSAEITETSQQLGRTTPRALRIVADRTRPPKDLSTPWEDLQSAWHERADRAGLSSTSLHALGRPRWDRDRTSASGDVDSAQIVSAFERPFSQQELIAEVASSAVGGMAIEDVERNVAEVIDSGRVRPVAPARYLAFSDRTRRVPRIAPAGRFVSKELGASIDRVRAAIEDARRWTRASGALCLADASRAVRLSGDADSLSALRALTRRAAGEGTSVVALAANDAAAGHFAAVSGIPTRTEMGTVDPPERSLVVLYGPLAMTASRVEAAIEWHRRDLGRVIFVDRGPAGAPEVPSSGPLDGRALQPSTRNEPNRVAERDPQVTVFAPEISHLDDAVREAAASWRRVGHEVVVVAADSLHDGGVVRGLTVPPRSAAEAARADPRLVAVVIGDERVLGTAGVRAFGERRTHVFVEPVSREHRLAIEQSIELGNSGRTRSRVPRNLGLNR